MRKLFGQSFNYYDGEPFVGLPFGQLGDFGALVRSESLVLTEEILREAYRDPEHPDAPEHSALLAAGRRNELAGGLSRGISRTTYRALAGYTFADGSDHRTRGYFAQSSRVEFDFQRTELAAPRTSRADARPARQRHHARV